MAKRKHAENRKAPRDRVRLKLRFWNEGLEGRGFTRDASSCGLFIETATPVDTGTQLHFEVELHAGPFLGECVVMRAERISGTLAPVRKPGIGVRLMGLSEAIHQHGARAPRRELEMDLSDLEKLAIVYVRDIKRGGVFILCNPRPEMDETVTVRFLVPKPHESIDTRGVVIHVMDEPRGVGLELLDIDPLREQLEEILTG